MGRLVADPEQLRALGNKIIGEAQDFRNNSNNIFTTVNEMATSDYLSPDARVLASEINSHREELAHMAQVIEDYGNFCLKASSETIRNQENNIAGIRNGSGSYE